MSSSSKCSPAFTYVIVSSRHFYALTLTLISYHWTLFQIAISIKYCTGGHFNIGHYYVLHIFGSLFENAKIKVKVILHQFWVKKIFPWKLNLEYGGTFYKLFMHVSSRNMFPTTRNPQIRVHVYRPRHYCGDWLTFGGFVPMIADHDLVTKR